MSLACPQCKQVYEKNSVCPLCNVVLLYHAQNLQTETLPSHEEDDSPPEWQHTPWGKIIVGLILAQGLIFGMQQLLTAGFLMSGDGADVWRTLLGLVFHHAIYAISLLIGGALTGAGQTRGIIYGSLVGFASGLISLFTHDHSNTVFPTLLVYAEPIIHLATGAIGGGLGMLIWQPIAKLPDLGGSTPTPVPAVPFSFSLGSNFAGPVHFGRVCAGAFVIVIGVVWSQAILEFLLRASNGTLTISSKMQAQLVSMEIIALVALLGSGFAGATTRNGLKQGLCVGLCASVVVLGIQCSSPKFTLESGIFTVSGIAVVSLIGGWFGGQLFPPLIPNRRKRGSERYA
jgi:hypothetical protein